ncbi:O-antigen ligase [Neorhodopirellula lusitana]|uniref:O-antigen ligase n=1 Tax=Neorhodopirellula lusitana TaxID=445327 RepID=A0ABY1PYE3_9BACT|nr:O-antigen ligase family protein [Neorhodopirellula lusitana]SMP53046.1 O-antigen ligase [Neorhodopirellula lusitana]
MAPLSRGILPWIVAILLIGAAAINPVEFKTSADFDRATQSTGVQTFLKLGLGAGVAAIAALALLVSPRTRRVLSSVPAAALVALGIVFLATSVFAMAEIRTISVASALLYMVYLIFLAAALATLGVRNVVGCLIAGSVLYLVFTLGLYVVFPERGQFVEYTSDADSVIRMGGTGHPNNIAKTAIATGLALIAMLVGTAKGKLAIGMRDPWVRLFCIGSLLLVAIVMVGTMSRTAILAGGAATAMLLFDRFYGRGGVVLFVSAVSFVMVAVLAVSLLTGEGPLSESAVGAVTKSGDVEEITSLTGRTVIWEEAIGFIAQRPVTGWGLDSAASVMSKRATGTHNLLLHVSFSAGLLAAAILAGLLVWSFLFGALSEHEWIRAVMVYVLVSGLVEDTIFESFPTTLTMLWMVALMAPVVETLGSNDSSEVNSSDVDSSRFDTSNIDSPSLAEDAHSGG